MEYFLIVGLLGLIVAYLGGWLEFDVSTRGDNGKDGQHDVWDYFD